MSKSGHLGLGALEKWDIATTTRFLKLYRDNKCLWDHTDSNYKDKNFRNAALDDISNLMGLPSFDTRYVILKIRALRSTYIYERRKVRQRLKNGEKFQTHLGWYHLADSFLRNFVVEKTYMGANEDPNKDLPPPMVCFPDDDFKTFVLTKDDLGSSTAATQLEFFSHDDIKAQQTSAIEFTLEEEDDDLIDKDNDNDDDNEEVEVLVQENVAQVTKIKAEKKKPKQNLKKLKLRVTAEQEELQGSNQQQEQQQQQQQPQTTITSSSVSNSNASVSNNSNTVNKTETPEKYLPSASNLVGMQTSSDSNHGNNSNFLKIENNDDNDEFEAFAKSVAMQLRKIPKEDAYGLQVQFQFLLSQAKLKALGKSTSIVFTDPQNYLSFINNGK